MKPNFRLIERVASSVYYQMANHTDEVRLEQTRRIKGISFNLATRLERMYDVRTVIDINRGLIPKSYLVITKRK